MMCECALLIVVLTGLVMVFLAAQATSGQSAFPGKQWDRRDPADLGLDGRRLEEFAAFIGAGSDDPVAKPKDRRIGCVVRNGYLAHAWGDPQAKFDWYSSSKPVVSTLLFFAVDKGLLPSVDARIVDLGWALAPKDQPMTFAHLADQVSGYALAEAPGAAWSYNDLAFQLYVLSLEKVFGRPLSQAAQEYLAPLSLEDGDVFDRRRRVVTSARDFARLGWFWMNRGRWAGQQVLLRAYLDAYMRPHVPPDLPRSVTRSDPNDYLGIGSYGGGFNQGPVGPGVYGFNWWFNGTLPRNGQVLVPAAPLDMVMALGARGSYMAMLPSEGLLVAAQGDWGKVDELDPLNRARFNQALELLMSAVR